jgi:hypothetical protein
MMRGVHRHHEEMPRGSICSQEQTAILCYAVGFWTKYAGVVMIIGNLATCNWMRGISEADHVF